MIAVYRDCLGVDTVLFGYLSRARSRKGVVLLLRPVIDADRAFETGGVCQRRPQLNFLGISQIEWSVLLSKPCVFDICILVR